MEHAQALPEQTSRQEGSKFVPKCNLNLIYVFVLELLGIQTLFLFRDERQSRLSRVEQNHPSQLNVLTVPFTVSSLL